MGLEPRPSLDVGSRVRSERRISGRGVRWWTVVAIVVASVVLVAGAGLALRKRFGDYGPTQRSAPSPIPNHSLPASRAGLPPVASPAPTIVGAPGIQLTPITGLGGAPGDPVFGSDVELVPAAPAAQVITVQVPCADPTPGCPARKIAVFMPSLPHARQLPAWFVLVAVASAAVFSCPRVWAMP